MSETSREMAPEMEAEADRALYLAGRLAAEVGSVSERGWEAAAARAGLAPPYRDLVLAALAFRRATSRALLGDPPARAQSPAPIPPPLPQAETAP